MPQTIFSFCSKFPQRYKLYFIKCNIYEKMFFRDSLLQDFAYRISIGWWIFAVSGVITIILTTVTVGRQAIKAATANPVDAIKSE